MKKRQKKVQTLPTRYKKDFLKNIDGRMELAKDLRKKHRAIMSDLGGEENLSAIAITFVEKFVWLDAILKSLELKIVASEDNNDLADLLGKWVQALNCLVGLGKSLGLQRRAKHVDLKTYIDAKKMRKPRRG